MKKTILTIIISTIFLFWGNCKLDEDDKEVAEELIAQAICHQHLVDNPAQCEPLPKDATNIGQKEDEDGNVFEVYEYATCAGNKILECPVVE